MSRHWTVGLLRHPDGYYTAVADDGSGVPLDAQDWRGGEEAVSRVLARIPQELWLLERD